MRMLVVLHELPMVHVDHACAYRTWEPFAEMKLSSCAQWHTDKRPASAQLDRSAGCATAPGRRVPRGFSSSVPWAAAGGWWLARA